MICIIVVIIKGDEAPEGKGARRARDEQLVITLCVYIYIYIYIHIYIYI